MKISIYLSIYLSILFNFIEESEIYQRFGSANTKKYGYRVKNRSYLRFCPAKSGFLDVNNEKCLFLTQEKATITNFSAKINYTSVERIRC